MVGLIAVQLEISIMRVKSSPLNLFKRSLVTLVSKVENEKSDIDDAREISAFLTYFKEHHTVVLGN